MWIFTTIGFLSAVEDRQQPGNILVRFRDPDHAKAFVERAYAGRSGRRAQIRETPPPADYRWKVSIARDRFTDTVAMLADDIDYNNFKSACHARRPDPYPHGETMQVWSTMNEHQRRVLRGDAGPRIDDYRAIRYTAPELFDDDDRQPICGTCVETKGRNNTEKTPCPECGCPF